MSQPPLFTPPPIPPAAEPRLVMASTALVLTRHTLGQALTYPGWNREAVDEVLALTAAATELHERIQALLIPKGGKR